MRLTVRALLPLLFAWPLAALASAPAAKWVNVPISAADPPGKAFFSEPPLTTPTPFAVHAQSPQSQLEPSPPSLSRPADPKLGGTARAVQPIPREAFIPVHVLGSGAKVLPPKPLWPVFVGLVGILISGLCLFLLITTGPPPPSGSEGEISVR